MTQYGQTITNINQTNSDITKMDLIPKRNNVFEDLDE